MNIYHYHHIIPKHMGGKDDSNNLKKVTIEEHAQLHKDLFNKYGKKEDYLAYLTLSKQINHKEVIYLLQYIGGKNRAKTLTKEHQSKAAFLLWSKPGMREHLINKRKQQINPMLGKKQKQCCCVFCKKQVWNHTLKRHLRSHKNR